MSRMAEMAVYEEEQENLSGIDDCEYQEYIEQQYRLRDELKENEVEK